ncbi:site-specific tyrosine recombinase XerC [Pannonibacter phragmitetus]|uniref:Site-specific tyrosine recombinase XerC n=1 Tax=Pannonibacter phragmitetus TaxID=121719 RepID=A0A378ZUT3_9HYPH|nr:site-specific integrase [Pannonibacter phragmitetus]SUB00848.1 site-specific tyrosine recombinase XerC [Pannonibacter phragmitetus]
MPDYFFREGSGFSFRRRVPERLQPRIGLKEIYRSLKTSVRSEARRRAAALFLVSERLFELSEYEILSDEEVRACARRWLNMPGWRKIIAANIDGMTPAELRYDGDDVPDRLLTGWLDERWTPEQERQEQAYSALLSAGYQGPFERKTIDRTLDELLSLLAERVEKRKQLVFRPEEIIASPSPSVPGHAASQSTTPLITPEVHKHAAEWQDALTGGWGDRKAISSHSARQYGVAVRLFIEIIGNKPVGAVSREDAGIFRSQLLRLPSTHGKGRAVHALKAIEQAERAGAERATMKTVKRHMTAMNGYWAWLTHQGHLPYGESPFSGHAFPGTKSSSRDRDDWSAEGLELLFNSGDYRTAPADSALHWLPLISLHSGMRLEEICRLRPAHDIASLNGIPCFIIQPHPDDGWDPKTEAGERKIPVHSWLIEHGLMNLVEKRRQEVSTRLFPGMVPNRDNKLSAEFSREFSRLKTGLGFGRKVVFHSFRHTFKTVLESTNYQERHINSVMGHEGLRGEGATYVKRVLVSKLKEIVEAFECPLPLDFLPHPNLETDTLNPTPTRFGSRRGKRPVRIRDSRKDVAREKN